MTWTTHATSRTKASPEAVWKLWADVDHWRLWDADVEWSRLEGSFLEGTRGSLKPKSGPVTKFVLTRVDPHSAFTNRSKLPLGTLDFIHRLRVEGSETVIEHRVEMNGPLTFLFRYLIGANLARSLPKVVERLARDAEKA